MSTSSVSSNIPSSLTNQGIISIDQHHNQPLINKVNHVAPIALAAIVGGLVGGAIGFMVGGPVGLVIGFVGGSVGLVFASVIMMNRMDEKKLDKDNKEKSIQQHHAFQRRLNRAYLNTVCKNRNIPLSSYLPSFYSCYIETDEKKEITEIQTEVTSYLEDKKTLLKEQKIIDVKVELQDDNYQPKVKLILTFDSFLPENYKTEIKKEITNILCTKFFYDKDDKKTPTEKNITVSVVELNWTCNPLYTEKS